MKIGRKLSLSTLIASVTLAGCASSMANLSELPTGNGQAYKLAAGDEVRIVIPGLGGLDGAGTNFVVNDKGQISIPLLGGVDSQGKTVPELEQFVAARLVERQLLVSPSVSIQPVSLRPFYILGEVAKPGEYPYRPNLSVLAAVSMAGGYTFRADQRMVAVTRTVNGQQVTGKVGDTSYVQPGDTIRVTEKWF